VGQWVSRAVGQCGSDEEGKTGIVVETAVCLWKEEKVEMKKKLAIFKKIW